MGIAITFYFAMEKVNMRFNRYIFVSLLINRCVLFNNSCHNNLVCNVRTPYFGRKGAFTQSCITLQPLQLLKKYFGELWPRSWLFGGIHFQFSIVNFIFHHFCTTLCHLIVILPNIIWENATLKLFCKFGPLKWNPCWLIMLNELIWY